MGLAIADHGKHRTIDEMVGQRIDDYGASKEYMGLVFDKTEAWLASLDPSTLTEIVVARPFPPQIASTYSARVAGGGRHHLARRYGMPDLPARPASHG